MNYRIVKVTTFLDRFIFRIEQRKWYSLFWEKPEDWYFNTFEEALDDLQNVLKCPPEKREIVFQVKKPAILRNLFNDL